MKSVFAALLALTSSVMGLNIKLDFFHDEAADQFFSSNLDAKAAIEKAASDLGGVLSNNLTGINSDIYSGTNGTTTAQFDWSWNYINPVTGNQETINAPSIADDTVVIYVGTRKLSGLTLGQGGAGGAGVLISGIGHADEWIDAVDLAEANSNTGMGRGSGPTLGTISGAADYSGYIGQYDLDYGLGVGNLWFDSDTDNDGSRDSDAMLRDFWHYDANTPVATGKTDFYSVALHEILHVMGIGTSQTWESLRTGSEWLGDEASLAAGTSNLLAADGHHAFGNLTSVRLNDGLLQEALVSPSIAPGIRKELTELDVAFLADLGYEIAASPVPEPSSILFLAGALLAIAPLRRR